MDFFVIFLQAIKKIENLITAYQVLREENLKIGKEIFNIKFILLLFIYKKNGKNPFIEG